MDPVTPLEWGRMFLGEQPPLFLLEIIAKVGIVYVIALIVLRTGGKRARKQMTPLEVLLIVALGSAVGDVLFYPTVAVIYTLIILLTVVVLQWITARFKRKSRLLEAFINSKPKLLVNAGEIIASALNQENMTEDELLSKLREKGVANLGQVQYAFMELSGGISVFKYDKGKELSGLNIIPDEQEEDFLRS